MTPLRFQQYGPKTNIQNCKNTHPLLSDNREPHRKLDLLMKETACLFWKSHAIASPHIADIISPHSDRVASSNYLLCANFYPEKTLSSWRHDDNFRQSLCYHKWPKEFPAMVQTRGRSTFQNTLKHVQLVLHQTQLEICCTDLAVGTVVSL